MKRVIITALLLFLGVLLANNVIAGRQNMFYYNASFLQYPSINSTLDNATNMSAVVNTINLYKRNEN